MFTPTLEIAFYKHMLKHAHVNFKMCEGVEWFTKPFYEGLEAGKFGNHGELCLQLGAPSEGLCPFSHDRKGRWTLAELGWVKRRADKGEQGSRGKVAKDGGPEQIPDIKSSWELRRAHRPDSGERLSLRSREASFSCCSKCIFKYPNGRVLRNSGVWPPCTLIPADSSTHTNSPPPHTHQDLQAH